MNKRVIFMGTPSFATAILETLLSLPCDVVAVISQPDRPVGRKQILSPTAVKEIALKHSIPVLQPEHIKDAYDDIVALKPDLIVTCAYGQFIPSSILNFPMYKSVNVHASLLPKHRGGAPIHTAIIKGDKESGVTLMRMVKQMDAGPILFQAKVEILENETMGQLHDKLMECGSSLLKQHFNDLFDVNLKEIAQDESQATFSPNISREMEFISFNRKSNEIVHHINGLSPWPVAYGLLDDKKIKFYSAYASDYQGDERAGTILGLVNQAIAIKSLDGMVCIPELQLEGKKRINASSIWAGNSQNLKERQFKETL